MGGFPNYDAKRIALLDAQAAQILSVFAAKSYARVEPPILQPAEVFLDRSGEEIRRRTFVLTDPEGTELCLRPDLTIPVCRMHLETKGAFPARLAYHGPAFRFQPGEPDRPSQFLQTGVECLGVSDRKRAEIEVLELAVEGVRAAGLKIVLAQDRRSDAVLRPDRRARYSGAMARPSEAAFLASVLFSRAAGAPLQRCHRARRALSRLARKRRAKPTRGPLCSG